MTVAQPLVGQLGALGPGTRLNGRSVADLRSTLDNLGGCSQGSAEDLADSGGCTGHLVPEAVGDLTGDLNGDAFARICCLQSVAR